MAASEARSLSSDGSDSGRTKIHERFEKLLDNVESAGSFACFGSHTVFPLPGLEIAGSGPIGLPLSHRDAAALKDACHKSPFGKGSRTIVDESVRKTWELDASQFQLTNPAWLEFEKNIVNQVEQSLGATVTHGGRLVAHRYKLLLYEKGAMFKAHQEYVCQGSGYKLD